MKQAIYMFFLSVCAVTLGGLLGNMVGTAEGLSWLGYSKTFAFEPGTFLNIDVLKLTFGVSITFNIAQLILLVVAVIVYSKTASKLFSN